MSEVGWEEARRALLAVENPHDRRAMFAAWLSEHRDAKRMRPVVVGGHALETHTSREYRTGDLDLIVADAAAEAKVLRDCGFDHAQRVWWHAELGLAVDLIEQDLAGDWRKLVEVETPLGVFRVLGPEDIIIDRLNSAVHWQAADDLTWVAAVMRQQPDLDWDYLERRAREELVLDAFNQVREQVAGYEADQA